MLSSVLSSKLHPYYKLCGIRLAWWLSCFSVSVSSGNQGWHIKIGNPWEYELAIKIGAMP